MSARWGKARHTVRRHSAMRMSVSKIDLRGLMFLWRRKGEQRSPNGSSSVMFDLRPNEGEQDINKPTPPHAPHGWQKDGYKKNGTKQPQQLRLRIMGCFCFG